MKQKYKYGIIFIVAMILFFLPNVIANPQILTYRGGHWFNDRNEEINTIIIEKYNQLSYPEPWTIEVISPILKYKTIEQSFDSGETIQIKKGGMTFTLTADTTTTFTIMP